MDRTNALITIFLIIPVMLLGSLFVLADAQNQSPFNQISDDPVVPSNPTNVVIRESAVYDAPIGDERPISELTGLIYWEELAGSGLNFFTNTSDVIEDRFYDYETNQEFSLREGQGSCAAAFGFDSNCVETWDDRYVIIPGSRSFAYEITSYYDPDIVQDTGFIVVFNSQSVDFSLVIEGEEVFARVDYSNRITLPRGAGIVSQAPIDEGFLGLEFIDGRWSLSWAYVNRAMDSRTDPLQISVTYAFDPIFLAFTEQVYQNQQEQQRRQEEINRLNLIQTAFVIIATFAIIASLFSVLFAYLLARRKFEPQLQKAKELPRREAADIEASDSLKVPVKSMFLSAMIILPMLFSPVSFANGQTNDLETVQWNGTFDLQRDLFLTETIEIELPVARDVVYVYTNTSESELTVFDDFGIELVYSVEDNRYVIQNPGLKFSYELYRPYTVSNNSNMLVWLDRFWLEFSKPVEFQTDDDPFFNVDLKYSVILPEDAIIYSATPSELLTISSSRGRTNVTFLDTNRRMDAFHDVFETQVTFSYIDIFDALENLNTDFVQIRAERQDIESLVRIAATEVLLFSLLGLIAPLISFIIAYWVFRRRYMRQIEQAEKDQEEKIFVEADQIQALVNATGSDSTEKVTEAYLGHYYRILDKISKILDKDITIMESSQIIESLERSGMKFDLSDLMQILTRGSSYQVGDELAYSDLLDYVDLIERFIGDIEERN